MPTTLLRQANRGSSDIEALRHCVSALMFRDVCHEQARVEAPFIQLWCQSSFSFLPLLTSPSLEAQQHCRVRILVEPMLITRVLDGGVRNGTLIGMETWFVPAKSCVMAGSSKDSRGLQLLASTPLLELRRSLGCYLSLLVTSSSQTFILVNRSS